MKLHCLNPISKYGIELLTDAYEMTDDAAQAEGILVRSASMHEMELPEEPEPESITFRWMSAQRRAS